MKVSGNTITLDWNELAHAVDVLVNALGVTVSGSRTVTIISEQTGHSVTRLGGTRGLVARVDVDPSAVLIDHRTHQETDNHWVVDNFDINTMRGVVRFVSDCPHLVHGTDFSSIIWHAHTYPVPGERVTTVWNKQGDLIAVHPEE